MCSKDADRITNRVDPDQTAPGGAVWSGSALFSQTYLSQYFKLLRYVLLKIITITKFRTDNYEQKVQTQIGLLFLKQWSDLGLHWLLFLLHVLEILLYSYGMYQYYPKYSDNLTQWSSILGMESVSELGVNVPPTMRSYRDGTSI